MVTRDILCKSVLTRSGIGRVDYAINPYVGCSHACVYCYASFMKRFTGHAEPWGSFVDAKTNAVPVLDRQLGKARSGRVMLSSVTDPYQPLEARTRLTRGILERLQLAPQMDVSILTKSTLVLRDVDILGRMPQLEVGLTLTTLDDRIARLFEPGASPPSRRMQALRRLSEVGISTWAFLGPLIPSISDDGGTMREILVQLADAGVREVLVDRLNTYPSARSGVERALRTLDPTRLAHWRWALDEPYAYGAGLRLMIEEALGALPLTVQILF